MSKGNKNKKIKKDQEEVAALRQQLRREKEQRVAQVIEQILLSEGFALQPFMQYSEFGIAPRVRLVENNHQSDNDQASPKADVDGVGDKDGAAESSKP